jgi:hypothetical protein
MTASYVAVAVTEYYGPKYGYAVLSWHDSADDARKAADAHDPDFDADVNAHRLAHNQSSPTRGEVYRAVATDVEGHEEAAHEAKGRIVAWEGAMCSYIALEPVEEAR